MSPDSQQPQDTTPTLPDVPQLESDQVTEPVTNTQPVQETVPMTPVTEPQVSQVTPSPVAPVMSQAAQTNAVENQLEQATAFPQNTTDQPVQQPVVPGAPILTLPVQKKRKLGLIIGLIVGGFVLLAGLAVVLLVFVFPSGKVSESDLVSSTTDSTTYLRPKQWQGITINSISGYGDKKGKNDTSSAAIFVQKKNYIQSGVKSASSSALDSFRETVITSMTTSAANEAVKETGVCTSTDNVTVHKSSVTTSKMVGILKIDGTCKRDDGTFMVAIYVALGDDGYLRSIAMMSTESLWKQNEAIFNKMLASADQS